MENQLAELYNKIANKINSMIPTKWDELYYLGEVEKGKRSWSSVFYFIESAHGEFIKAHDIPSRSGVSQQIYDELLSELNELLLQLYNCFEQNEQEVWEQVSFKLSSKGNFNVDFFYDVMNENDGGQAKEIIWAYETFGFLPKKGNLYKRLLDKYIKDQSN